MEEYPLDVDGTNGVVLNILTENYNARDISRRGVTTVLSLSSVGMTVRAGLPRVPYATALDIFLFVCLVYATAALVEYAAVNYFTKVVPVEGEMDEEDEEEESEEDDVVKGVEIVPAALKGVSLASDQPEGSERERQTLLEDQFRVIEVQEEGERVKPYQTLCCCWEFWRCFAGNIAYRVARVLSADPEIGNSVSKIDIICRRLFPTTFVILNIFYWFIYLYFEPEASLDAEKIITT